MLTVILTTILFLIIFISLYIYFRKLYKKEIESEIILMLICVGCVLGSLTGIAISEKIPAEYDVEESCLYDIELHYTTKNKLFVLYDCDDGCKHFYYKYDIIEKENINKPYLKIKEYSNSKGDFFTFSTQSKATEYILFKPK